MLEERTTWSAVGWIVEGMPILSVWGVGWG